LQIQNVTSDEDTAEQTLIKISMYFICNIDIIIHYYFLSPK